MKNWRPYLLPAVLMMTGLFLIGLYMFDRSLAVAPPATAGVTGTPEPLIPTRTPTPTQSTVLAHAVATLSPTETATPPPEPAATPVVAMMALRDRFGVGAAGGVRNLLPAQAAGLPFRHYLTWWIHAQPVGAPDLVFWQMVRLTQDGMRQEWDEIAQVAAAQPGSFWIVGNEPDVIWQDNVTPERYAELYHDVYTFIKAHDPTAQLAAGGVAQPTALRLAYWDRALAAYERQYGAPMPVDLWTVHAFILREEAGSWGVDIPPGMAGANGRLYEIADHDNMAIFQQGIIDFRAWMAANGYRERPLAITEYGLIMPPDYGFPPAAAADFMVQSFDFLATAANETGYPPDGNRLAQWWFWYSLSDVPEGYPASNLYDPRIGMLTALGQAYADYVAGIDE